MSDVFLHPVIEQGSPAVTAIFTRSSAISECTSGLNTLLAGVGPWDAVSSVSRLSPCTVVDLHGRKVTAINKNGSAEVIAFEDLPRKIRINLGKWTKDAKATCVLAAFPEVVHHLGMGFMRDIFGYSEFPGHTDTIYNAMTGFVTTVNAVAGAPHGIRVAKGESRLGRKDSYQIQGQWDRTGVHLIVRTPAFDVRFPDPLIERLGGHVLARRMELVKRCLDI